MEIFVQVIVEDTSLDFVNSIVIETFEVLDEQGNVIDTIQKTIGDENYFITGLSETGVPPPTHHIANGYWKQEVVELLVNKVIENKVSGVKINYNSFNTDSSNLKIVTEEVIL